MIYSLTSGNFLKSLGRRAVRFLLLSTMGGLAVSLTGCSAFHEEFPGCASEAEKPVKPVILRLSVDTGNISSSTRTDTQPDDFEDPQYYPGTIENFEKIESLRVIIIHELDLNNTKGVVEANRLVATTDEGIPLYDNLNFEVLPNQRKRIYLVANEAYLTAPANSSEPTASRFLDTYKPGESVDLTALAKWVVWMPGTSAITPEGFSVSTSLFQPSSTRRLPLTEFFDVQVAENEVDDNDMFNAVLFLTRTAAKARFFIATGPYFPDSDPNNPAFTPSISSISISGIGDTEYVFPRNAQYSILARNETDGGNTKKDISKQEIWESLTNSTLLNPYITYFETPQDAVPITFRLNNLTNNSITKLSKPLPLHNTPIYFPESVLTAGKQFMVSVKLSNGKELTAPLETNILDMAGVDAIARDTYLPIEITFNGVADITVEVIPWTPEYYEFDFTDQVGQNDEDFFSPEPGTYESVSWTTGELVLNPFPNAFTGSFGLSSPVGARWDAYLVTLTGDQNIIQFQTTDDEGNVTYTNHLSGIVGTKNTFKVAPTTAAGTETRSAILQVTVTMLSGLTVPVNILLNGEGGDNLFAPGVENITFVQHPQ